MTVPCTHPCNLAATKVVATIAQHIQCHNNTDATVFTMTALSIHHLRTSWSCLIWVETHTQRWVSETKLHDHVSQSYHWQQSTRGLEEQCPPLSCNPQSEQVARNKLRDAAWHTKSNYKKINIVPLRAVTCTSWKNAYTAPKHAETYKTRMWANAQRDGRPAKHRWRLCSTPQSLADAHH